MFRLPLCRPQRAEDELCNMLLEILLCVMWRGVEGSDDAAWLDRGQVFSALTKLGTANELLLPVDQIKLRLESHVVATLKNLNTETVQALIK